ncbi:diacylglycerol/lipid kinase family protein [Saliterribacillus persicus]|uniref:YegS/Rv2252/BmrU family lipid kinase n=1 Tax=Saliterribacillus persicus TaxID=930114 RepID=A0A368XVN5_9BACI|nr:diacylglycerol kinase family protein [Saliterribacillus persicus]RCW72012.1 YegS/Rv2252/BmrU family lipid kinase [Saliterribacillus persicus]
MKQARIILNPSSGTEKARTFKEQVVDVLKDRYDVFVEETEGEGDATRFAENACIDEIDLLVIMGGDGTINEVVNGLAEMEYRPIIGIIPLGTVNNFPRAIGLPLRPKKAIELLKEIKTKHVDVGKVNNGYFINLINIGALAEATYNVSAEQKTKFGSLAYFLEGIKTLQEEEKFSVKIETDNESFHEQAMLVLVAITDTVASIENVIASADVNDGFMHLFIMRELNPKEALSLARAAVRGEIEAEDQIIYCKTKKISITADKKLTTNVDGDEGFELPLEIEILPKQLEVVVDE